jgi:anti-anti-sigma factor
VGLQADTNKIEPDVTVVHLSGNLTFEDTNTVTSLIQVLLDRGEKKLVLELSGVERIDSLGGACLIHCFFAAREATAGLCIASASLTVEHLFKTIQVNTLIPFFPTITEARKHFTGTKEGEGTA